MKARIRARWQPKAGNHSGDYEDAFWPYWLDQETSGATLRFAVADGATESSFARLWARLLVLLYCNPATALPAGDTGEFAERIARYGKVWARRVFALPLEWHALAKAERGAFSALVGLSITADQGAHAARGRWHATAIGDSCLFHLRDDQLVLAAPIAIPEDFGYHPQLIATDPAKNWHLRQNLDSCTLSGDWRAGDQFLLMTDALACWFLTCAVDGGRPWQRLAEAAHSQAHFAHWLDEVRRAGEIRNDDVTLLSVRL